MPAFNSVGVIGAGAWGTALATVAARAGRAVTLYARDAASCARIAKARENPRLPGIKLGAEIAVTNDLAHAGRRRHHPRRHARAASARRDQCHRAASARAQRR